MTEEFPLTDEKLDELFVKNIGSVARLAEKLPRNDNILTTCTRWFEIFEVASQDEKLARNFMLLLMHQQLNDKSNLSYPFTDARSCQRDLNTLHKMSLGLQMEEPIEDDEAAGSVASSDSSDSKATNQQLMESNSKLARDLHALQCEKQKLLQRRRDSLINLQTLHDYSIMYQKEISYLKNIFFCSAITALELFKGAKPTITDRPQYFIKLFKVLCKNEEDMAQVTLLDELFGHNLREHLDYNIRKTMCEQLSSEFDALRAKVSKKYKKLIENKEASQSQQLSQSGMNYLMLLKKLFKDTFKGDELLRAKAIKFLQKEYNGMVRE